MKCENGFMTGHEQLIIDFTIICRFHSQVTKEDKKKLDEAIDRKGEANQDFGAMTAKKTLALAPTENYTDITNIGDKANHYVQLAPGLRETRLTVLHGNVVIYVNVDISDEDAEDLAAAKKVAEAVIGLCDQKVSSPIIKSSLNPLKVGIDTNFYLAVIY